MGKGSRDTRGATTAFMYVRVYFCARGCFGYLGPPFARNTNPANLIGWMPLSGGFARPGEDLFLIPIATHQHVASRKLMLCMLFHNDIEKLLFGRELIQYGADIVRVGGERDRVSETDLRRASCSSAPLLHEIIEPQKIKVKYDGSGSDVWGLRRDER